MSHLWGGKYLKGKKKDTEWVTGTHILFEKPWLLFLALWLVYEGGIVFVPPVIYRLETYLSTILNKGSSVVRWNKNSVNKKLKFKGRKYITASAQYCLVMQVYYTIFESGARSITMPSPVYYRHNVAGKDRRYSKYLQGVSLGKNLAVYYRVNSSKRIGGTMRLQFL